MADEVAKTESVTPLSDVFSSATSESSESKPSEATDSPETEDKSSSTEGDETKSLPTEKSDESEDEDAPSKSAEEIAAEKAAADKDKPKEGESKDADKKAADETADTPFKQRFEETRKWANEVNQQNQQLRQIAEQQQQKLAELQKKVDGTWSDEDEAALHKGESTEDVATRAVQVGKALADKAAALKEFGPEKLNEGLTKYKQLFGSNQIVQAAIAESESPVHEALAVVERYEFQQQYGQTPKEIKGNIEKELRATITKELRKSILEEIRAGKSKRENTAESLANTGGDHGENSKLKEESPVPLKDIF